jgi:LmbE family N-acetylglucosaminyl deacetylase
LAHPDDESLGVGGTLARYAAEGVETFLITATRGERGRNRESRSTAPEELGALREAELREAARVLGISEVHLLGYGDGMLDQADASEAIRRIAALICRIRPHVVLTFGPDGAYGHPDHIAISQFATAAVMQSSHRVHKLYYMAWTAKKWDAYQAALKKLTAKVDGVERQATPWPDWAITTVVDTERESSVVWRAVSCHQTQMSIYSNLEQLSDEHHRALWGSQEFYRVFSLANGGRGRETDLFDGLRHLTAEREAAS